MNEYKLNFNRLKNVIDRFGVGYNSLSGGFYTDNYFLLTQEVLDKTEIIGKSKITVGKLTHDVFDSNVDVQIFHRHSPHSLVAGIDIVLYMLKYYSSPARRRGENEKHGWETMDVESVSDGTFVPYYGDPLNVSPVIKIRGNLRHFLQMETPMLGILSRLTRIATNVFDSLEVANGKPIMFFPARFDLPQTQPFDGYAYWLAVRAYNAKYGETLPFLVEPYVSTQAQAYLWGGTASGTMPHTAIAAFLGDLPQYMCHYALTMSPDTPKVALVDYHNDCFGDTLAVAEIFWRKYLDAYCDNDISEMLRWTLGGVRIDTSAKLIDIHFDQTESDKAGVSPALVTELRQAINNMWQSMLVPSKYEDVAKEYFRNIKIFVSGGFTKRKIAMFENQKVPVDVYAVGSDFLRNDSESNTDFTMDVCHVQHSGKSWLPVSKVGRKAGINLAMKIVDKNFDTM